MKKTVLILTCCALVLFNANFGFGQTKETKPAAKSAAATPANAKTPRNVVEFFRLLPNRYAGNYPTKTREATLKKHGTIDSPNGYLEILAPEENKPNFYMAIFRKDAGGYLVTTASGIFGEDKPFAYYFLEYDGKKWTDVSAKVLPKNFSVSKFGTSYNCELPRFDRTMNCRDSEGNLTYLGWTGKDFVIE